MRYLYIGLGILAVILIASILCLCLLRGFVGDVAAALDAAIAALDRGDTAAAEASARQAEALWQRYSGFLCAILDHAETDAITRSFANVSSYAATDTTDEFRASCVETVAMIRHVADMEMPYYYNIL